MKLFSGLSMLIILAFLCSCATTKNLKLQDVYQMPVMQN